MDHYIAKGMRIRAQWLEQTDGVVAGAQMKICAESRSITGTITHVRGNHPIEPTSIRIWVQPDDGSDEVVIEPQWIREVVSG